MTDAIVQSRDLLSFWHTNGYPQSGYTCFTQYIGHKENAILEFFSIWMGE